jgi:hypothetical protein
MKRDWRLLASIVCVITSSIAYIKFFDIVLWRIGLMVVVEECPRFQKMSTFDACKPTIAELALVYAAVTLSALAVALIGWAFLRPKT